MAWQLTIGGNDYSDYNDYASWRIYLSSRHRGSQATFTVTIPNKEVGRPKGFQEVILKRTSDNSVIFGGVIQRVTQREVNPKVFDYYVSCSDYTRWLDHIPIGADTYTGLIATNPSEGSDGIVNQIIADAVTKTTGDNPFGNPAPAVPVNLDGVKTVNVSYTFQPGYIPVSQALDHLAQVCNCIWFVGPNKSVYFFLPDDTTWTAPLPNTGTIQYFEQNLNGNNPPYDNPQSATLPIIDVDNFDYNNPGQWKDLEITEDVSSTISGVTIRDFMLASDQKVTENDQNNKKLIGDGVTKFFGLYNPPIDPAHTTVRILNTDRTVFKTYSEGNSNLKVEYQDGQPGDDETSDFCYVCSTNYGIRFVVPPDNGKPVEVEYNPYIPDYQDAQPNQELAEEIARREGFGPGYYYAVISDQSLSSPITLADGTPPWLAQEFILLNRYSRFKILAKFKSRTFGWRPAQVFGIKSTDRGDTADAPTYNVWGTLFQMKMYVLEVEMRLLNNDQIESTIMSCSDPWGE